MAAAPDFSHRPLDRLPLVTLYVTDKCNSRCVTCDYWRHGRDSMTLQSVRSLLPDLKRLQTETVLLSGGEPLLHPEWPEIANAIRANGQKLWLLTSGLSLAKHANRVAEYFDAVTVSLDGADAPTYQAIRGVDAFDVVCRGIRAVGEAGLAAGVRVTLQRSNFRQLPQFVELALALGAHSVSFLAIDVDNPHAFGRLGGASLALSLEAEDLGHFEQLLLELQTRHAAQFSSGFIVESPHKMQRIAQYFAAQRGKAPYPAVRCNVVEFSAVIAASGRLQPCFFIPGPSEGKVFDPAAGASSNLERALNGEAMTALRTAVRAGQRPECKSCVCSLWRDGVAP